jgi:hypothetical protein
MSDSVTLTGQSRPWGGQATGDCGPYTDAQWRDVWETLFDGSGDRGPLLNWGGEFEVTERGAGANMSVDVADGAAIIDGEWAYSGSTVNLDVAANASGQTRYDLVFLHWTAAAQVTNVRIVDGTPGAGSCEDVSNYQNAGVEWAVPLACVEVANGAASIQDADITDLREFCRFRLDPADIIDGATLDQNASNQIQVADGGIGVDQIAAAIAGDGLTGGAGSDLDVNVDGVTLEINADQVRIIGGEVTAGISENRTRTWYVGANELHEPQGGLYAIVPTWGNLPGHPDTVEGWLMDPGQDMGVVGHDQAPADLVGGPLSTTVTVIWSHESGAGELVRWYFEYCDPFECDASLLNTEIITINGVASAASQDERICTEFTVDLPLTPGDFLDFVVGRNGSHPVDTYGSDVVLLGVEFSYTADM